MSENNDTSIKQESVSENDGWNDNIISMAILTSVSHRSEDSSDDDDLTDKKRREKLDKNLRRGHFAWFPVMREFESGEESYIVYNVPLQETFFWCEIYGLQSVFFINEAHCEFWVQTDSGKGKSRKARRKPYFSCDMPKNYCKTFERDMPLRLEVANADDFYTQVCRECNGGIPFFDGRDENKETLRESMRFVIGTIKKRMKTLDQAKCRIRTSLYAGSGFNRYCNRGMLYGNCFCWNGTP